jgi:Protein of unknown function (DUF3592)
MNTPRFRPVTSSTLTETSLRFTGKKSWMTTDAVVFSCDWMDLPDQIDSKVGHYHVVYTYRVDGTLYTGRFADYGMQDEEYLKRDEVFQIRYNPQNPEKSYYPELRTRYKFILISCVIGAAVGIIVLTLAFLTGHFHN